MLASSELSTPLARVYASQLCLFQVRLFEYLFCTDVKSYITVHTSIKIVASGISVHLWKLALSDFGTTV
jgi:hypothetical protein